MIRRLQKFFPWVFLLAVLPQHPALAATAIAFSPSSGHYGFAFSHPDQKSAERQALEQCSAKGGGECQRIVTSLALGFAAIAKTCRGKYCGIGISLGSSSHEQARKNAVADCLAKYRSTNCQAVDSWEERGRPNPPVDSANPLSNAGQVASLPAPLPLLTLADQQFQERLAQRLANVPQDYLQSSLGLDYTVREKLIERLEGQLHARGHLLTFPFIKVDREIDRMRNNREMLKALSSLAADADPLTEERFDREMSLLIAVASELDSSRSIMGLPRDAERAARWYERSLALGYCTNLGELAPTPCRTGEGIATARLSFLCISGQACTHAAGTDKSVWFAHGARLLQPYLTALEHWEKAGAAPDAPLLADAHHFAIFLAPETQLKMATIRADKIRALFISEGAVEPHPDWRILANALELQGNEARCAHPGSVKSHWENLIPDLIRPLFTRLNWPDWLELSVKTGSLAAAQTKAEIASGLWAKARQDKLNADQARWETEQAHRLRTWRTTLKPGIRVRWKDGQTDEFEIARVTGDKATSVTYQEEVCVRGIHHYSSHGDWDECHEWRPRYFHYQANTADLYPKGYDARGNPVNTGGEAWAWRTQKTVGGQGIETPDEDCEATRMIQSAWRRWYP